MSKTRFIITRERMVWEDAVDYGNDTGRWLPSIEMASEYNLPLCWTCNTSPDNPDKAFISSGIAVNKSNKILVIFVEEQDTKQDISFRGGDIKSLFQ